MDDFANMLVSKHRGTHEASAASRKRQEPVSAPKVPEFQIEGSDMVVEESPVSKFPSRKKTADIPKP